MKAKNKTSNLTKYHREYYQSHKEEINTRRAVRKYLTGETESLKAYIMLGRRFDLGNGRENYASNKRGIRKYGMAQVIPSSQLAPEYSELRYRWYNLRALAPELTRADVLNLFAQELSA